MKMSNAICQLILKGSSDIIQKLLQNTVSLVFGIVFFVALISGWVMYLSGMDSYWTLYLLGGVCVAGWLINQAGHKNISAFLLIGSVLAVIQFNIYNGYGMHDVAIVAWPALIIFAGLLYGPRVIPPFALLIIADAVLTRFLPNVENFYGDADTGDLALLFVILIAFSLIAYILISRNEASLQKLRQSEESAQAIFNSVNDAIFIHNIHTGAIVDVNEKMLEMFGYSRQEALNLELAAIGSGVSPYHAENAREWLAKAASSGPQIFEWLSKDKNGRLFWTDVNMRLALISGQPRIVVSVRDMTDRKQAEEAIRTLNLELEQRVISRTTAYEASNRELEAFAYSVSHDLRAPLRTLNGFSSILLEEYRQVLDETGQSYLLRIHEASTRMGQLINDLLDLSRITRAELILQAVNISKLADDISAGLQSQAPQRQVKFEISANMLVSGDPVLLNIALENLLNNAFKFTNQRDKAVIQVGITVQAGKPAYFVRDNGAGFDMAYAQKLFTPFHRLHGMHEFPGTGIGLATVQRIISRHGGRIWAESAVGQGATFYFTLGEN